MLVDCRTNYNNNSAQGIIMKATPTRCNSKNSSRNDIFQDKFTKLRVLGKGNFGEVFLAECNTTKRHVAIKVVDTRKFKNLDQKRHSDNEKEICKLLSSHLKHRNIVDVIEVCRDEHCIYFVLEYVDGGELYEKIKSKGRISEKETKKYFKELIQAIAYIHKHGIVHRDLKPENVLLDKTGSIRLCDFGFGKVFDTTKLLDTYCGSPFYAAPEMVTATPYRGPPVDMWSCGVILYAMLTGQLPFHCNTMPELFKKIDLAHYFEPTNLSDEALHLIKCLLTRNPKRRITAEGVLKHAWLADEEKVNLMKPSTSSMFIKKMVTSASTFHALSTTAHTKHHHQQQQQQQNYTNRSTLSMNYSPASTLPSPIISVCDEEMSLYKLQDKQKPSKATRFLLQALHKKSQVAPSKREKKNAHDHSIGSSNTVKGNKVLLVTAERVKKFFTTTFVHKRLTSNC